MQSTRVVYAARRWASSSSWEALTKAASSVAEAKQAVSAAAIKQMAATLDQMRSASVERDPTATVELSVTLNTGMFSLSMSQTVNKSP